MLLQRRERHVTAPMQNERSSWGQGRARRRWDAGDAARLVRLRSDDDAQQSD